MAAPRRSKRIQALNQSNEGSLEVTDSPGSSKKYHREKRRTMAGSQGGMSEGHSKGQAPKKQAPAIDPAAIWAERQKQEDDEKRRKRARSKEYIHERLALDRQDWYVKECWKGLRGSIGSLVNVPSLWDVPWDSLDEALQQKFISYAPNAEDLFGAFNMTWRIFQRWVWEIIDENFFSDKSKDIVWASPYWEAQATIERYLRDHNFPYDDERASHKFPHWRHTTMEFYMSLKDSPQNLRRIDPTCVVPIIAMALGRYFPEEHEGDPASKAYSPTLQNLANNVVNMEFCFDANLTVFSHVFHHPITQQTCGFPYSPELEGIEGQAMEAIRDSLSRSEEGQNVDFVAHPMLQQCGHHHGYDYNVKTAMYPMKVCVAWLETSRNPPDSPAEDGEEEYGEETDDASVEKKSEEHDEDDAEDEEDKEEDKEEDDKDEEDQGIIKEGKKNNKNKERADEEIDDDEGEGEEEEELTKQKEIETHKNDKSKRKNEKKNKGRC